MPRPPNILLILTDQLRHDAVASATGGGWIRTPALDRLAAGGTTYTSAWTPSPVCVPARASLLYGQYPWRTGCMGNGDPMPDDAPSYADSLAAAGYQTHAIGKCHFTPDPQAGRGFASRERQEELVDDPQDDEYLQWLAAEGYGGIRDPQGARSALVYMPQISTLPAGAHPTRWVGDRACAYIEQAAGEGGAGAPWCLLASFIHPHPPYAPPSPWDKLYWPPDMPAPHCPPGYAALRPPQADVELYHYHLDGPQSPQLWRQIRASYAACVSFVDQQVGRLLDTLAANGLDKETLVVFTSDHGDMLGDYDLVGKGCMFDASVRVPLIVRWPDGRGAGTCAATPVSLVDLAPTFLAAAGAPAADHDGCALQELPNDADRMVFSQIRRGAQATWMAVDGQGKYIYRAESDRELSFDRQADPGETHDAGATPWRGRLKSALQDAVRHHYPEVLDGADWRRYPPAAARTMHRNRRDNLWADYHIPGYTDPE